MALKTSQEAFTDSLAFTLTPENTHALLSLCGEHNNHLSQIEQQLAVTIGSNSFRFHIAGEDSNCNQAKTVIEQLYRDAIEGIAVDRESVHLTLQQITTQQDSTSLGITTPRIHVRTRGNNQTGFVRGIRQNSIQFGIGPAGTGKTWLAVSCALEMLFKKQCERLILTRPAVEAGEKLGFLPGDLNQKIDPYLRPLFDSLYDMAGYDTIDRLMAKNLIEVAPLAYMRGRSLNNACIILDEGQNTTIAQMKMFLTRMGFGSKAIITGDTSQVDLPPHTLSGLTHAQRVLHDIRGVGFTVFSPRDIVRHPVVQSIVRAYAHYQKEEANDQSPD